MTPNQYRAQWATLTGRRESDVYVPEGVRERFSCTWCSELTALDPMSTCSMECTQAEARYLERWVRS